VEGQDERRVRKEKTEWHRVSVLAPGLVKLTEQYLKKGGRVYIEGLETRDYTDKDKVKRYVTEIVLWPYGSTITMLDGLKASAASEPPGSSAGPPVFYHLAVWRRPRLELRFYFSAEVKVTVEICEPVAVKPPSRPRFVE